MKCLVCMVLYMYAYHNIAKKKKTIAIVAGC